MLGFALQMPLKKTADVKLPMPAGLKKVDEPVAVKAEETAADNA